MSAWPRGVARLELAEIDSTNAEAARRAKQTDTPLWIIAERQTQGRGRRGRAWDSPRGNLMASLLLPTPCDTSVAGQLSFVAALALFDTVARFIGTAERVRLKWPNDVLLDGGKICGILLEAGPRSKGRLDWLVVGCGMNIAHAPADTPYPATSLGASGLEELPTPKACLTVLAAAFARYADLLADAGFEQICALWRARAVGIGAAVSVRLERETLSGTFLDVDTDGALLLALADGRRRRIAAGDVYFPRQA